MLLINIAIVDDCADDRTALVGIVGDYLSQIGIDAEINQFVSGESFLESFVPQKYDIVFLDVIMNKLNGIETAVKIYNSDKKCSIIFLTSSMDYAIDGYKVSAFRYILKPVKKDELSAALDKWFEVNKMITVTSNRVKVSIPVSEIIYCELKDRNAQLHLTFDRTICAGREFPAISTDLLKDDRFLDCYQGIIVNMNYIKDMLNEDFILKNDEKIPFRKRDKTQLKTRFFNYQMSTL